MNFIKNFIREEDGVTAIEYGLIAAIDRCRDHRCRDHRRNPAQ